jgi:methylated-DNA-[protein]-cysteine S-methyltransferase
MTTLKVLKVKSPIGLVRAAVSGNKLCDLDFSTRWAEKKRRLELRFSNLRFEEVGNAAGIANKLEAYLAGDLGALDTIEVETGGTEFQQKVWRELRRIPVGVTISYGELARRVGNPKASRPVGAANGQNPVAIVIPCHRVIGADGTLTGYASGVERKRWLLEHEGVLLT